MSHTTYTSSHTPKIRTVPTLRIAAIIPTSKPVGVMLEADRSAGATRARLLYGCTAEPAELVDEFVQRGIHIAIIEVPQGSFSGRHPDTWVLRAVQAGALAGVFDQPDVQSALVGRGHGGVSWSWLKELGIQEAGKKAQRAAIQELVHQRINTPELPADRYIDACALGLAGVQRINLSRESDLMTALSALTPSEQFSRPRRRNAKKDKGKDRRVLYY